MQKRQKTMIHLIRKAKINKLSLPQKLRVKKTDIFDQGKNRHNLIDSLLMLALYLQSRFQIPPCTPLINFPDLVDISEIVKTDCSICETVSSLVRTVLISYQF